MIENKPAVKKPQTYYDLHNSANRIIQVFLNADCRFMLPGLVALCKRNKLEVEKLSRGQLIVFLNTQRTYIKLLACNETKSPVLACYRLSSGRVVDLSVIAEIPRAFKAGALDYDQALKEALLKNISKRRGKNFNDPKPRPPYDKGASETPALNAPREVP